GAEVVVRVVVERAPSESAGVLRIGSEMVVNACVTNDVLQLALVGVDRFGGKRMADELGVEKARMVRLLQRPAEIVERENVFEELRTVVASGADAACLSRGVERARQVVGAGVEVVVVRALVDANAPENDGRVVPVAAHHAAHVVYGNVLPGEVADVLPAGNFFQHQQAEVVASIQDRKSVV